MLKTQLPHRHPARLVAIGFLATIAVGSVLLSLPFASASHHSTSLLTSFFTATSAVSMTGLAVVDTSSHWSGTGQAVIIALIQIGGFGIMGLTSLAGMIITGHMSLRWRVTATAEGRSLTTADVKKILIATFFLTVFCELTTASIIATRMAISYGQSFHEALWSGIFYSISAFNNAGFALEADSLTRYVSDIWIIIPLSLSFIIGGIGFPVVIEIIDKITAWRKTGRKTFNRLSLTARISLTGTAILIAAGTMMVATLEWAGALHHLPTGSKILAAFFQGASPRTAGFNSIDYGSMHPTTLMGTDILMFIGGGSAGTAGGVKITTFAILCAAMIAQFRGHHDTTIHGRKIPNEVTRQSLTVFAAGIISVTISVGLLRVLEPQFSADQISFEVISAFSTVGLSTGITANLSGASQIIICALMYLGRIGPITLVASLAAKSSQRQFSYPEERPFIG
ncbi:MULTISPECIES: TrkH family potassium uptake protein [unclassified Corynebacterium]|uniref:TrkH family potassium uptake protein n=1 Tax=unclassified Corynebacterium TaxID=2624378 RepID=UPI0029CA4653|nr:MULTISPECIES: potassium transporter TrkG [unclassified Corynebacterium]WPF66702.1 potassium transporter TrkG [Corynebacterium sp. 22KM0430]WPF69190.1 potassium transporter TrkG [Corynebacterium sp. 21KM1197]